MIMKAIMAYLHGGRKFVIDDDAPGDAVTMGFGG